MCCRVKYLKYTPEHLHCLAYIYAPSLPPGTPVLGFYSFKASASFRVAATGVVLQTTAAPSIQKKLKLVGEAKKIFKNTAFIRGMFNSDLEVARFIGMYTPNHLKAAAAAAAATAATAGVAAGARAAGVAAVAAVAAAVAVVIVAAAVVVSIAAATAAATAAAAATPPPPRPAAAAAVAAAAGAL